MARFRRSLVGYQKKEVDNFLHKLEQELQKNINEKQQELIDINSNNEELLQSIEQVTKELVEIRSKEMEIKEKVWDQLRAMENRILLAWEEASVAKKKALQQLKDQSSEVDQWYGKLHETRRQLMAFERGGERNEH